VDLRKELEKKFDENKPTSRADIDQLGDLTDSAIGNERVDAARTQRSSTPEEREQGVEEYQPNRSPMRNSPSQPLPTMDDQDEISNHNYESKPEHIGQQERFDKEQVQDTSHLGNTFIEELTGGLSIDQDNESTKPMDLEYNPFMGSNYEVSNTPKEEAHSKGGNVEGQRMRTVDQSNKAAYAAKSRETEADLDTAPTGEYIPFRGSTSPSKHTTNPQSKIKKEEIRQTKVSPPNQFSRDTKLPSQNLKKSQGEDKLKAEKEETPPVARKGYNYRGNRQNKKPAVPVADIFDSLETTEKETNFDEFFNPKPKAEPKVDASMLFTDKEPERTEETPDETPDITKESTEITTESTEITKEITDETKETTDETIETTDETKETPEATEETTDETKETIEETKETIEETKETTEKATETTDKAIQINKTQEIKVEMKPKSSFSLENDEDLFKENENDLFNTPPPAKDLGQATSPAQKQQSTNKQETQRSTISQSAPSTQASKLASNLQRKTSQGDWQTKVPPTSSKGSDLAEAPAFKKSSNIPISTHRKENTSSLSISVEDIFDINETGGLGEPFDIRVREEEQKKQTTIPVDVIFSSDDTSAPEEEVKVNRNFLEDFFGVQPEDEVQETHVEKVEVVPPPKKEEKKEPEKKVNEDKLVERFCDRCGVLLKYKEGATRIQCPKCHTIMTIGLIKDDHQKGWNTFE